MDHLQAIRQGHGLDIPVTDEKAATAIIGLRSNLSNALCNLSEELYTKSTHFVLEFIQNADDNVYDGFVTPTLEMQLNKTQRLIEIRCNERGFTKENVSALCSVGKSTKKNQVGYIGEKGIGFKSVFTIADTVEVLSGAFTFKFDRTAELGMIAPIPISERARSGWTTFRLHIRQDVNVSSLSDKLGEVEPTLLLFLRKLREFNITVNGTPRRFLREDRNDGTTRLRANGTMTEYLVVRRSVNTLRGEKKRENVSTSEIVLAFPIDANGAPIIQDQNVHTFLPLRSYKFKFVLQADFLTTSNREDILTDNNWNLTLRNEIAASFCAAIPKFEERSNLRFTWLRYIPHDSFDHFMAPVAKHIKPMVRLRGQDGRHYSPSELVIVPQEYKADDGTPLIPERFASAHYLSFEYDATRDQAILAYLGVKTMDPDRFVRALRTMDETREHHFSQKSSGWVERVSAILRGLASGRWSSYRSDICLLRVVPMRDGSWVSATTSNIFFDAFLDDVPSDIPLNFVRRLEPRSAHRLLLAELDIKEATASQVVSQIVDKHNGYLAGLSCGVLLTHAEFLFRYARGRCFGDLKVYCKDGRVWPANQVYMDSPSNPAHLQPSVLLQQYGAALLHDDYTRGASSDWRDWLCSYLSINTTPRVVSGSCSSEFSSFVASAPTSLLLATLRHYWAQLQPSLPSYSAACKALANTEVDCSDGSRRPLRSTYLRRQALARFDGLPFLEIEDPNKKSWDFLASLGVTLIVDCALYLKRLVHCSGQDPTERTEEEVREIYEQLQARFNDDACESEIRKAFRHGKLFYVPATSRFARLNPGVHWVSFNNAHWDGPLMLSERLILTHCGMYRSVQKLFCQQLPLTQCPQNALLVEMRTLAQRLKDTALDQDQHHLVFDYLKAIDDIMVANLRGGKSSTRSPDWLSPLGQLAIFPAKVSSGDVKLCAMGELYYADRGGGLEALFEGQVSMLKAPEKQKLSRIMTLVESDIFSGSRSLTACVDRSIKYSQSELQLDVLLSECYSKRLTFIKRLFVTKHHGSPQLDDVQDLVVYEVENLSCVYTLGNIVLEQPVPAAVEVKAGKIVLLRCSRYPAEDKFCQFMEVVAEELNLPSADIHLVFLPEVSDSAIARVWEHMNVRELEDAPGVGVGDIRIYDHSSPPACQTSPQTSRSVSTPAVRSKDGRFAKRKKTSRAIEDSTTTTSPSTFAFETVIEAFLKQHEPMLRTAAETGQDMLSSRALSFSDECSASMLDGSGFSGISGGDQSLLVDEELASFVDSFGRSCHAGQRGPSTPRSATGGHGHGPPLFGTHRGNGQIPSASNSFPSHPPPTPEEHMTGILGEFFVYKLLLRELPVFSAENWTSELRKYVPGFSPYTEDSLADFCYPDSTGKLTEQIFANQTHLLESWRGKWPVYHLEVKSTSSGRSTPFHLSRQQLQTAASMTIDDTDNPPDKVYALVRVWNARSDIRCEVLPDPHRLLYGGGLEIVSDVSVVLRD